MDKRTANDLLQWMILAIVVVASLLVIVNELGDWAYQAGYADGRADIEDIAGCGTSTTIEP